MFRTVVSVAISFVLMVGTLMGVDYVRKPNYELFQKQTVRIVFTNPDSQKAVALCSGVYIGDRSVITAGHCSNKVSKNVVAYVYPFNSEEKIYAHVVRTELLRNERGLPVSDLGLLKLERDIRGVPPAPVSCRIPELGEELYAVGMPVGLYWTVTKGSLTTWVPRGNLEGGRWLQLDMTVVGGNSGGPVFDRDGNLVGIISHIRTMGFLGTPTGHAYGVSSREVCRFLNEE